MSGRRQQQRQEGLSTAAKVGIGVGVAAVAVGAGALLAKLFSKEPEQPERHSGLQASAPALLESQRAQPKSALQVLEKVCANIKLNKEHILKRNEFILNLIRTTVIDHLSEGDLLFSHLYQDVGWTGSYYEGLKISAPDEFDLNIIFRLPVKQTELDVTCKNAPSAYVCINRFAEALQKLKDVQHPHYEKYNYAKMESWCSEQGALRQDKVRNWFESLLAKFLNQYRDEMIKTYGLRDVVLRKSGPAMTLILTLSQGENNTISIDLVPAIEFRAPMSPPSEFRTLPDTPQRPWYAVPKPVEERNDVWRLSFCKHESDILLGRKNVKPAIKLIKKLRDTRNWKNLCSYFIKSVALWEILQNSNALNNNLDVVFMHLLRRLQQRLEEDDLYSYWDPRFSLIGNMRDRENVANALKRIITQFEREYTSNPSLIGRTIDPNNDY